jgi:DNA polymerase III delta prime subunit
MDQIRESFNQTGKLHHAYCLVGDREQVLIELDIFLQKYLKFKTKGSPDFWCGEFNVLKVDDCRKIGESHLSQPVGDQKMFVIAANSITKDAQNSLLKIFEEPAAHTTFFLVMPSDADLLPTLKSRLIVSKSETSAKNSSSLSAKKFLLVGVGERLNMITKVMKDIKDEKSVKADVIAFLKELDKSMAKKKDHRAVTDIEKAISYASDESPSLRVILEHLAVTL